MITRIEHKNIVNGNPEIFEIGKNGVIKIKEAWARGEGDRCVWTVEYEDRYVQIFNPHKIIKKGE